MPINIDKWLIETCQLVSPGSRNEFGDYNYQTVGPDVPCLYQDSLSISQRTMFDSEMTATGASGRRGAVLWLGASASPAVGQVYNYNGKHYQVKQINREQRRLRDNSTQFYECFVQPWRQIS